jgi:transglutaminase-like putative cysteine protease
VSPYWRVLVLDQYEQGVFRISPRLRIGSFERRDRTGASVLREPRPRLGAPVYWTFFLEPGVSRYLPFPGPWERVQFRESQNFRLATDLALLALREEPVTMTAYRVEGVEISPTIPDPAFARRWKAADETALRQGGLQSTLSVSSSDTARLRSLAEQISGGAALSAGEFAERAGAWLRERHPYSLSPVIPRGAGDPLVRWMSSREAGHCELFAGSLVLLARAAGFPARVVTGFRGGTWNAYSNNFTIRHSDAHAWTEIFDPEIGAWRRTDALAAPEVQQAAERTGEEALAQRADSSWKARFDSLRVFWYRRIVSFDGQSQTETLRSLKVGAQRGGQQLRETLAQAATALREWIGGPWDVRRVVLLVGWVAAGVGLVWLGQRVRLSLRHWRRAKSDDPVRADARRWLVKLAGCPAPTTECAVVRGELQRLRFGARATWPEPEKVFRRAQQALRAARRARPVTPTAGA